MPIPAGKPAVLARADALSRPPVHSKRIDLAHEHERALLVSYAEKVQLKQDCRQLEQIEVHDEYRR